MNESDNCEHGLLKRNIRRTTETSSKLLNAVEYLSKTVPEIKQEFRKLSNPPAYDTHAAK